MYEIEKMWNIKYLNKRMWRNKRKIKNIEVKETWKGERKYNLEYNKSTIPHQYKKITIKTILKLKFNEIEKGINSNK